MTPIEFFVAGKPKGQPRIKACRRGKYAGVYDPGTADGWKMLVRAEGYNAWDKKQIEGAVKLQMTLFLDRPKSHFNSKGLVKPKPPYYVTGKPDVDNYAKAVMDALTNLGIWKDDSQVVGLEVWKVYADPNMVAGCKIKITPLLVKHIE